MIDYPQGRMPVRHVLEIAEHGERFEVTDERIENERPHEGQQDAYFYYRFHERL